MNKKLVTGLLIANLISNQIPLMAVTPDYQEKDTSKIVSINKDNETMHKSTLLEQATINDTTINLVNNMTPPVRINYAATKTVASGTCGAEVTWTLNDAGTLTISGTGAMTDYDATTKAPWNAKEVKNIVIKKGVTRIGNYAFDSLSSLNSVDLDLAESITEIGDYAFNECSGLTSIGLYDIITVGKGAFIGCTNLQSVSSTSIKSIGNNAFERCAKLKSISFSGATSIGNKAFFRCTNLEQTTLSSVTKIGSEAFGWCTKLENIKLPSVITLEESAFSECEKLVDISFPIVQTIGDYAFFNCKSLTSITLPDSMTSIGEYAFGLCKALTDIHYEGSPSQWKSVTVNDTSIGKTNTMHYSTETIYTINKTGAGTVSKLEVKIGDADKQEIDLTTNKLILDEPISETEKVYVFVNGSNGGILADVNGTTINYDYKGDEGTCGDDLTWFIQDDGTLNIMGTGAMTNYTAEIGAPWSGKAISSIRIAEGVTSIGNYAFDGCSTRECRLSSTVESIGDYAFNNCTNFIGMESISCVKHVGNYAFNGCSNIMGMMFYSSVESIGDYAFSGCSSLKGAVLPYSLSTVGEDAFKDCSLFEEIEYLGTEAEWSNIKFKTSLDLDRAYLKTIEDCII